MKPVCIILILTLFLWACTPQKKSQEVSPENASVRNTTFSGNDLQKPIRVAKGDRFAIELPGTSPSLPPQYQFIRLAPEIQGTSLQLLHHSTRPLDPKSEGSRERDIFEFEATAMGKSSILFFKESELAREQMYPGSESPLEPPIQDLTVEVIVE